VLKKKNTMSSASPPIAWDNVKYLSLCGGGARGILHIAGLAVLSDETPERTDAWLARLEGVAGTSAGAVTALLIACGCNLDETTAYLLSMRVELVFGRCRASIDFLTDRGLANCDGLEAWLSGMLGEMGFDPNMTFRDLRARTGKQLVVTVSNMNKCETMHFGLDEATLDERVVPRVIDSMALPFVFAKRYYRGDWVGDGGWFESYPMCFPPRETVGIVFTRPPVEAETKTSFMEDLALMLTTCNEYVTKKNVASLPSDCRQNIVTVGSHGIRIMDLWMPEHERRQKILEAYEKICYDRGHLKAVVTRCLERLIRSYPTLLQ
jgi:hypothetical protein